MVRSRSKVRLDHESSRRSIIPSTNMTKPSRSEVSRVRNCGSWLPINTADKITMPQHSKVVASVSP